MFGRRRSYPVDVSVVILSHREGMLPDALASALAQTHPSLEVVVRYSKDTWPEKLNGVVRATAGEFVVLLCDDDVILPTFVAECLEAARLDNADVVYTDRRIFTTGRNPEDGIISRYHPSQPEGCTIRPTIDYSTFIFGSSLPMTCLIRRRLWDQTKGYDTKLLHADSEWMFRVIQRRSRLVYLAKPLFGYRVHREQISMLRNTLPEALRQFHAKHRRTFGITVSDEPNAEGTYTGTIRPPWRKRLAAFLMRVVAWANAPEPLLPEVTHHVWP